MKAIRILFSITVVTLMLTSCSNDEPYAQENVIDYDYLNSLTRGTVSDGFELISWNGNIHGSRPTDDKYSNNEGMDPNLLPIHYKIFFLQGKVCFQLDLTSEIQDFHPLYFPLELYRTLTMFDSQYIIATPINIKNANKIIINEKEINILSLTKDNFKLGYREDFTSTDHSTGSRNYVMNYEKLDLSQIDTDKFLYYNTRTDALLDIARMLRSYFGDTIDVNPYFKNGVALKESIFNLKKIEENILAGMDWSFVGVCSAAK